MAAYRSGGMPRPRATVYHVLGALAQAGLVLVADTGPGRTLYEAATDWHHHLVRRACGLIVDMSPTRPCVEPAVGGTVVEEAHIIFRGACVPGSWPCANIR